MAESSKPILLTPGTMNHQTLWRPLAEHFTLAFVDDTVANAARSLDIEPVLGLKDFVSDADVTRARSKAMLMAADIVDAAFKGHLVLDPELEALHGLGMASWLPGFAHDTLAPTMARISACTAFHKAHPVAAVLTHEDVTMMGRAVTMWGNASGVPTLHLPHANHFSRPGTDDVHCRVTAKHLGVAGSHMEWWYGECGVDESAMARVGVPRWDLLYDGERLPTREHARRAFGIRPGEPVLGYGTTWYQVTAVWGENPEGYLDGCLTTVLRAARRLGAFLLVSMHPGEAEGQERHYADRMREFGVRGAIARGHPEHSILAADCFVIQGPSNFGVECGILGTPVVELYVPGARYPDYGPRGTWGDDLIELVDAATVSRDFVLAMNHLDDGEATGRTVEWVRGLIQ